MWKFSSKDIRTDCTCVRIWNEFIFAGVGCFLNIFNKDSANLILKERIFDYQKLMGIVFSTCSKFVYIHGENRGVKYEIIKSGASLKLAEICKCHYDDWILAAKFLNDNNVAIVSMKNKVSCLDSSLKSIQTISCPQKCIIYSAFIHAIAKILIFSGTVFNEIIIWQRDCILHRLRGHKGIIFSLDYNVTNGYLCSTSDDRTAILWKCNDSLAEVTQASMLHGHTARVFAAKILNERVITCGEDSVANVWNLEGKLLRKINANQGDSLWSVDGDGDCFVTGGGDSSVIKCSVRVHLTASRLNLPSSARDTPKRTVLTRTNNVVVMGETGILYYYAFGTNKWSLVARHEELRKYALLEASECRNLIAVAGYRGEIYVYKETNAMLALMAHCVSPQRERIYAFHWLRCNAFVTCSESGILSVWMINENVIFLSNAHILPHSSERWTTSARLVGEHLIVGDRKGNLYMYKRQNIGPISGVRKAHNYLGVTYVHALSDNEILTLGRNGIVRKFRLINDELVALSSDKLPFKWLTRYLPDLDLILAFCGTNFVLWHATNRCSLLRYNCDGGHRSWDFHTVDGAGSKFVHLHDRVVNVLSLTLNDLMPLKLMDGYHAWEINAVVRIGSFIVSGGEDTTLRTARIVGDRFEALGCLKSHLSSIRCMTSCLIETTGSLETYYLFSGGGRAQIVFWEIEYDAQTGRMTNCIERYSYYETIDREEAEIRVMDLATSKGDKEITVFAACSDGRVKVFHVDANGKRLVPVTNFRYRLKCIVKIDVLETDGRLILLTAGIDGYLNVWDVTHLLSDDKIADVRPFYSKRLHKSGVNTMSTRKLNEGPSALLLTGGDDTTVTLNVLDFDVDEVIVRSLPIQGDHCTQVSGSFVSDSFFGTCSTDQKVVVYKWHLDQTVNDLQIRTEFVGDYLSSVADLKGLDYTNDRLILHGKGIEFIEIAKDELLN